MRLSTLSVLVAALATLSSVRAADDPPTLVPGRVDGNNFKPFPQNDFCKKTGQAESDGTQNRNGACSSTIMGQIPNANQMVSTLIITPDNGAKLDAAKDLTVTIALNNLQTGFFDDPQKQYYIFPQTLNKDGIIEGHDHITIQKLSGKQVPDAQVFAFFKGLNEAAPDGKTLSVTMPAGTIKENGEHRICSMAGTFSHQSVIMPVAQRGASDDCIRVVFFNAGKVPPPADNKAADKAADKGNDNKNANANANNDNKNNNNGGGGAKLGACSADAAQLKVALGADPANAEEVRFVPGGFKVDKIFGGQGSALNGGIIANFICDRLADQCKADAGTISACRSAQKNVEGKKGGKGLNADQLKTLGDVADAFNEAIGISTDFAASVVQGASADGNKGGNNGGNNGGNKGGNDGGNKGGNDGGNKGGNNGGNKGNNQGGSCNAKKLEVISQGKEQRFGFDGRQVALNPAIPTENICNELNQNAACKAKCDTARQAVIASKVVGNSQGQGDIAAMQRVADQFNKALA